MVEKQKLITPKKLILYLLQNLIREFVAIKKKLVILSGAGISTESGIKTFRDSDGLWEGYNVMDVATPEGFQKNPELVLDFYNQRRRQLHEVKPNLGHQILADLENHFEVTIITQNVDNLHEQAGSSNVLHLHGELFKVRSVKNENAIFHWNRDFPKTNLFPNDAIHAIVDRRDSPTRATTTAR